MDTEQREMSSDIRKQLPHMPASPGVYIYRDRDGTVLYVGKAKNLRSRIRQYFSRNLPERTALLVSQAASVETIVAGSEKEALLVESNLIKRYRPHFNIDLKDDKSFPCFRVTVREEYPRLDLTRQVLRDGSLYFGPFTDAKAARRTLHFLNKAFPLRRCTGPRPGGRSRPGRPCIDYEMGRCPGPCAGRIDREAYLRTVEELVGFLRGRGRTLVKSLEKEMENLSAQLRFEDAAVVRDRLRAIQTVLQAQDAVGKTGDDLDVLGFSGEGSLSAIACLFIRSGMLMGRTEFTISSSAGAAEALDAFIGEHYTRGVHIPPRILCPVELDFGAAHEQILSELAGRSVRLMRPSRGRMLRLIRLAAENATQILRMADARAREARAVSEELMLSLKLGAVPGRIECLDISHTAGRQPYGSLVAWQDGQFRKGDYRLFAIRHGTPGDDYASMEEVILRRFSGSVAAHLPIPDLLLIDGGRGQLARAVRALEQHGIAIGGLAALSKAGAQRRAKGRLAADEVILPGRSNPVRLSYNSSALHLLQALRDEAHRFALNAHRRQRGQTDLLSCLDGIQGVGPARRKALLTRFRSVEEIRAAPTQEIAALKGFNLSIAVRIKEKLG